VYSIPHLLSSIFPDLSIEINSNRGYSLEVKGVADNFLSLTARERSQLSLFKVRVRVRVSD
jgi:hypothetical protein